MSVLQKVKVNDVDIPEGVTKYDLYKVRSESLLVFYVLCPLRDECILMCGGGG